MLNKKIMLMGGAPLQHIKQIEVDGVKLNLTYPKTIEYVKAKTSMFSGGISNISTEHYQREMIKLVVDEEIEIYELSEDGLPELMEEIKNFVEEEVEEEGVELTLQAINRRWQMMAKDKYLVNGIDHVGYMKDALKNVSKDGYKLSDLTPPQAIKLREEIKVFFREFKPDPKKIVRKRKAESEE